MSNEMDEAIAIDRVREYALREYPDYPTRSLVAEPFEMGWVVFPESDPTDLDSLQIGRTIFVIGKNGEIMESSSSLPPGAAEAEFISRYGAR